MFACIPNQTTDEFYVVPPAFVTCSSTQGNKPLSQTLQTLIIKWLARSLFIKHVTYRMSDIVQCNTNTHRTFQWFHIPRTKVEICQPYDMVYSRWTYVYSWDIVSCSHSTNVTETMMDELPPPKCRAPARPGHVTDNVCMWTPFSLQTTLLMPN